MIDTYLSINKSFTQLVCRLEDIEQLDMTYTNVTQEINYKICRADIRFDSIIIVCEGSVFGFGVYPLWMDGWMGRDSNGEGELSLGSTTESCLLFVKCT